MVQNPIINNKKFDEAFESVITSDYNNYHVNTGKKRIITT